MRSVYAKILLWCFATLALSLIAMVMVSRFALTQMVGKDSFFDRINVLLLEQAIATYETSGSAVLAAQIERADKVVGGEHHLIDPSGKDLATGENLSALARQFHFEKGAIQDVGDRIAAGVESKDKRYRLLVMADSPYQLRIYLPYYLPILAAVALLCWMLAARIASPLRDLTRAVERFGRGDLAARVNSRSRDEIGELGAAFDRMAERIGTLLTAERRLLQDVSHELRSPLARMSFAAELVRTAPDREAAVARLKKEIQRLTDLVGTLLEVTRSDGEPSWDASEVHSVNGLLSDVVDDCRLEAEGHGRRIELQEDSQVNVQGDPELLRRALENVLRNAIRYSPDKGSVDITIGADGGVGRISIRDYGRGVPEESLTRIFEPFFRVDDSRTSSTGGVGLGLTITDRAIRMHHGRIWAENAHPGLRIVLELPLDTNKQSESVPVSPGASL